MKNLSINEKSIYKCYIESFENLDDPASNNKLLELEKSAFIHEKVQAFPALYINNLTYKVNSFFILFNLFKIYLYIIHS